MRRLSGLVATLAVVSLVLSGCLAAAGDQAGASKSKPKSESDGRAGWTETAKQLRFDGYFKPVALLPELKLSAGRTVFLEGQFAAKAAAPALQEAQIRCTGGDVPGGTESPTSGRNTSNEPKVVTTIRVRWLFRAPATDTYQCALWARADRVDRPEGFRLYVQRHDTKLQIADRRLRGGIQGGIAHDLDINYEGAYVRPFRRGFEAVSGAQTMDVYTGLHVTNNYEGRASDYDSTVRLAVLVNQLDDAGEACGNSWSQTSTHLITREVHHDRVEAMLAGIPVRTERECTRQFAVMSTVRLESGSPVTVHDARYSNYAILMH